MTTTTSKPPNPARIKTARLEVRCSPEWHQWLKREAMRQGQSVSAYLATLAHGASLTPPPAR